MHVKESTEVKEGGALLLQYDFEEKEEGFCKFDALR
jgi:hypothetical protein